MSQAKWARLESSVNLGPWGNPNPCYVSLELSPARHPQPLLATHFNGKPLAVEFGSPLRLAAPVKLGLKNIKAIIRITYTTDEPADYWAKRGYSRYDVILNPILLPLAGWIAGNSGAIHLASKRGLRRSGLEVA